jgi:hypothetical protein
VPAVLGSGPTPACLAQTCSVDGLKMETFDWSNLDYELELNRLMYLKINLKPAKDKKNLIRIASQ